MDTGENIRIWDPGYLIGEEAYSLVIYFLELLEERHIPYLVQLFATGVNPRRLARAKAEVYPANSLRTISPNRHERFFVLVDQKQQNCKRRTQRSTGIAYAPGRCSATC